MAILTRPEILLLAGLLALIFVFMKNRWVASQPIGNEKMKEISDQIAKGAMFKADYQIKSDASSPEDKNGQFNFGTAIWF